MKRRRLLTVAGLVMAVLGVAGPALAYWLPTVLTNMSATAASLHQGNTPTVTVSGRDVSVAWASDSLTAATYAVNRYPAAGGTAATVQASCSGTLTAVSCVEKGLPAGTSWKYSVLPTLSGWVGTESGTSASAAIGTATLSLSASSVTADGGSLTATVANYLDNEGITYCVDSTTPCTAVATDTVPASGGSKATTVVLPAGLSVGSHTLYAIGSTGDTTNKGFAVTVGAPAKLAFTQQPAGAAPGVAFTTQPVVAVEDAQNNVVTTSSAPISLGIVAGTGTSGAALSGCTSTTTNGAAAFANCKIDKSGTGYRLQATATGLASATSASFDVTAPLRITSPADGASNVGKKPTVSGDGASPTGGVVTVTFRPSSGSPIAVTTTVQSDGTWSYSTNTNYLTNGTTYTVTATQGATKTSASITITA